MGREIKFQFIIDGKELSKPYTVEEIINSCPEDIVDDMEECDCQLNEYKNYCEGDCLKYEYSKITGKRQFTGLKDKNGKEIYEGDLFKNYQADVNEVIWYWDSWCYRNYHAEALPLGKEGNPYRNGGLLSIEIIGNIYENQNLLNNE